jgi:hypothetical protein
LRTSTTTTTRRRTKEEGEVRFQSSNNDVINEEILPDSEKSTK